MPNALTPALGRGAPFPWTWLAGLALSSLLAACGGGSSGGSMSAAQGGSYTAASGVAQKGPLIKGSEVTAQTLDANLSPTGQQYTYQVTSNLGTFAPTTSFTSQYVGVIATGYYFDEIQNGVSSGTITLYGYSDVATDGVLNVNLLTTLAYQRIRNLVINSHMTFATARSQAEGEVLTALHIPPGSYGAFGTLDLSGTSDGDHILTAMSSLFVYGNQAGQLSQLIANFQNDLGNSGTLTNPATWAALAAAAKALNPVQIVANLNTQYAAAGVTFSSSDITDWIDQDGDGVVGKFKFQVPDATPASVFALPAWIVSQLVGKQVSVTGGQLAVNGTPVAGAATVQSGDVLTVSTTTNASQFGMVNVYLLTGGARIARVSFVNGLQSLAINPANLTVPNGLTRQLTVTGTFSDSGVADLTSSVQWSSATPSVAAVSATGLLQAQTLGTTTITATLGSVSTSQSVTVTAAALESIAIAPESGPALLNSGIGQMRQLTVTGYYSDGTTADVTGQAAWTSSALSVASIGSTTGLITSISLGSTTITATVGSLTSTALFHVVANIWTATGPMQIARDWAHTETLLANGDFLIIGGVSSTGAFNGLAETEIYHPLSDTWTPAANVPTGVLAHAATMLDDGTILVTGGSPGYGGAVNTVEIYNPVTNTWTQGPPMQSPRWFHTATLLANGKVLVVGNGGRIPESSAGSAEIYDPVAKSWSPAAPLSGYRVRHTATLLTDGRVLVTGGYYLTDPGYNTTACATGPIIYDPVSDQWTATGSVSTPARCDHTATMLPNGKVLIAGGDQNLSGTPFASTEIYDPSANTWSPGPDLLLARSFASATLLPSGKVLIAGGQYACSPQTPHCAPPPPGVTTTLPTATSELFDPVANSWSMAANLNYARSQHTATVGPNGVVLVVGGENGVAMSGGAEIYW